MSCKCCERLKSCFTAIEESGIAPLTRGEVADKLDKLSDAQCETLCKYIGLEWQPHQDIEEFVSDWLARVESVQLADEIEIMRSAVYRRDNQLPLNSDEVRYIFQLGKTRGSQCMRLFRKMMGFTSGKKYLIDFGDFKRFFEEHCS